PVLAHQGRRRRCLRVPPLELRGAASLHGSTVRRLPEAEGSVPQRRCRRCRLRKQNEPHGLMFPHGSPGQLVTSRELPPSSCPLAAARAPGRAACAVLLPRAERRSPFSPAGSRLPAFAFVRAFPRWLPAPARNPVRSRP